MQPLPPAGLPSSSGPLGPARSTPPPAASGHQDRVEFGATRASQPLMTPQMHVKSAPSPLASPRPWPPDPGELSRGTALGALASGSLADLVPLARLLPDDSPSQARPTPDGWRVPKNPSRTPVRPRDPFEIQVGTEDLGPLTIVSNLTGRLRALRLQWPEEFLDPAFTAQQAVFLDILTRLSPDVRVHVVAEGLAAPALRQMLSEWSFPEPGRVQIHPLNLHSAPDQLYSPMTMWARDGALLTRTSDGREVLLLPRSFRGDGQVDANLNRLVIQGTGAAPALLAQVLPDLLVRRSRLSFEGGDVVASGRHVLVGAQSVAQNMSELKLSREAVVQLLAEQLGRPVVVVEPQPDFHLDLGFTFLAEDLIAVADPGDTLRRVDELKDPELARMAQITRDKGLAEKYERAARRLAEQGFRLARLPNLGGLGLTTPYLTYNNVLLESYAGIKKVYLPVYGVEGLDELARAVYRQHGYQVVDMPSARFSTRLWGAIRCATGELRVTDSLA